MRVVPYWRSILFVFTLVLWLVSAIEHDVAGQYFGKFFAYARDNWGPDGRAIAEHVILGTALMIAAVAALVTGVRVLGSGAGRTALPELGVRWLAWFLFPLAANRYLICLQSENVHFAQYGFIAAMFALATGNPRFAFFLTTGLGFLDEAWQWWALYYHDVVGSGRLEWTDMILNACGAAGGVLPFTSMYRIRRYAEGKENVEESSDRRKVVLWLGALAVFLVIFVGLVYLGHYPRWPFWEQLATKKAFHNFDTREGVPILLATCYLLHGLIDERRRSLSLGAIFVLMLAIHVAVSTPPTKNGVSVVEDAPTTRVLHTRGAITIDGVVDPKEWQHATSFSLGIFAPSMTEKQLEVSRFVKGAPLPTTVRTLWDEQALYVSFECDSADVWARELPRDHPEIAIGPVVEVFLDVEAAERSYYEFEVSAANRVQDLFVYWPEAPQWIPQPYEICFVGLNRWDCRGIKTAVQVHGGPIEMLPIEQIGFVARTLPPTKGYSVEIAIPWEDLRGPNLPPKPGARMRGNFYRLERPRPLGKVRDDGVPIPDHYMAWAPTHFPLDFHRPRFFGVLEFVE